MKDRIVCIWLTCSLPCLIMFWWCVEPGHQQHGIQWVHPEHSGLSTWEFNLLWPSDAIWWHKSGLTLAQVMACCLTAPSHYLNQCWLIIKDGLQHSPEKIFISAPECNPLRMFKDYNHNLTTTSPRGQCVKLPIFPIWVFYHDLWLVGCTAVSMTYITTTQVEFIIY